MSRTPETQKPRDGGVNRFGTDHLRKDLTGRSVRGGVFTMTAQAFKVLAQLATIVILARLLSPNDFGVFAIVMSLLGILELFKDLGLSSAIVQRETITERQASTLFWYNAGLGVIVAAILAGSGPLLSGFYGQPVLAVLAPAAAATLVVTGLSVQHLALLRRQMRFKTLAVVQTGAEFFGMAAAITAAVHGLGVWSLVVQRAVWCAVLALGAWSMSRWIPGRMGAWHDVRSLVTFGGNATGAMVLGNVSNNVYKLLIGWYWGAAPLCLFERTQKIVMMPVRNINIPLSTVSLPMLSRLQSEPGRYRKAYLALVERVAMLMGPAAGLLVVAAEPVTTFVFGQDWLDAAPILAWLGISVLYMPVTYTLSWLYMSQDRTKEMLRAGLINTGISMAAFMAALPFGPVAIAATVSLSGLLLRTPILIFLATRRGPVSAGDFAAAAVAPVGGAIGAAAAVSAVAQSTYIPTQADWIQVLTYAVTAYIAALAFYCIVPRARAALVESIHLARHLNVRRAKV